MSSLENNNEVRGQGARDRRHLSFFVAVCAVMAVVISFWVYFLPSQLKEFRLLSDADAERLRDAANTDDSAIAAQLELLRTRLEQEMKPTAPQTEEMTAVRDEVRRLQEKIEAGGGSEVGQEVGL